MILKRNSDGVGRLVFGTLAVLLLSGGRTFLWPAPTQSEQRAGPELINADINPTLRFPVQVVSGSFSAFSRIPKISYGWLEISRDRVRYRAIVPAGREGDGFELDKGEMKDLVNMLYGPFRASGKSRTVGYRSQPHWNDTSYFNAHEAVTGHDAILTAIRDFDAALAEAKREAAPPATPAASPAAPEPVSASPPTVILLVPSVSASGQTVEASSASLSIKGVAMDNSGIPTVTVNGSPATMRPKGAQSVEFWSDPIALQPGENKFEITATNAAHAQAKFSFAARYAPTAPASDPKALSKAGIIELLRSSVASARVAALIKERGIKFALSADDLKEIQAAGGKDDVIDALKERPPGPSR